MQQRTIYLVRHGDIGLNGEKRYIGQADVELSWQGLKQAEKMRNTLSKVVLTQVYCSDLKRTCQTATIIAADHKIQPVVLKSLREMSMGEWEGKTFAEIKGTYPKEFAQRGADIANYRTPGGESFKDCQQRVLPALQAILDSTQGDILLVTHAGVNRAILCHVMGLPLEKVLSVRQEYGCLNVISYGSAGYQLKSSNHTPQ